RGRYLPAPRRQGLRLNAALPDRRHRGSASAHARRNPVHHGGRHPQFRRRHGAGRRQGPDRGARLRAGDRGGECGTAGDVERIPGDVTFRIRLSLEVSLDLFETMPATREDTMVTHNATAGLTRLFRHTGFGVFTALMMLGAASHAGAVEAAKPGGRFDVTTARAGRPTLVNTVAALQKGDIAGAKAAFEAYDSAWNGIEMFINVRSKDMYDALEHVLQARIEKALNVPNPDVAALLADAQAILAKYDEAID